MTEQVGHFSYLLVWGLALGKVMCYSDIATLDRNTILLIVDHVLNKDFDDPATNKGELDNLSVELFWFQTQDIHQSNETGIDLGFLCFHGLIRWLWIEFAFAEKFELLFANINLGIQVNSE